ncbi:hypothetical protein [Bacillus sp. FSL R12-0069]|uniref:hypothetical protein n=1 Tax=Bacillus sp. FSL R12-0069 TaxID=2975342 RepID=UPI0030F8F205
MSNIDTDLQKKVDALGLNPVDDTIYNEHLKVHEGTGFGHVSRFKYYKLYGQEIVFYSNEHLIESNIKDLLDNDKLNYKRFCPSFFIRLKRKIDGWLLRRELNKMKKKQSPHLKK